MKSADRVLDLFELLNDSAFGLSHRDIADHLGIPKSSLSQLLRTMTARGYVAYLATDKIYQLGPRLDDLAQRKSGARDLATLAQPALEKLSRETQESAFLNVRHGNAAKLVAREIGPQALVTVLHVGQEVPLHTTAAGRAILAFLPRGTQDEYTRGARYEAVTARTVTSSAELRKRLDEVARERLCVAEDELIVGVTGVAAPILTATGEPVASLTISMPSVRYNSDIRREVAALLTRECTRLAERVERVGTTD